MRERVAALNARRAAAGLPVTGVYLGLHVGEVFYGNIGSPDRLDFTVVGPAVNEASRIAAMCRSVERDVLLSSAFAAAAREEDAAASSRSAGTRCAASRGRKSCSRSIGRGVRSRLSVTSSRSSAAPRVVATLLPIMAVVLIAFLVVGLALPVLPLHVHQGLGLGR